MLVIFDFCLFTLFLLAPKAVAAADVVLEALQTFITEWTSHQMWGVIVSCKTEAQMHYLMSNSFIITENKLQ